MFPGIDKDRNNSIVVIEEEE